MNGYHIAKLDKHKHFEPNLFDRANFCLNALMDNLTLKKHTSNKTNTK